MTKMVDVIIIGAGPAGGVCGYLLKKAGVNCTIVDYATFPREKVCGGGLTPKAYELLEKLMPHLQYDYESVKHFRLMMENKTLCEVDLAKELRMVHRKDFDYALLKQFLAVGGNLVKGAFSYFKEQADGKILVALKSGEQLTCDYLIGADGANSQVRKQLTGKRPNNSLWMERYVKKGPNEFIFEFSHQYKKGYSFSFPSINWDITGIGGLYESLEDLRLHQNHYPNREEVSTNDSPMQGAFISVDTVESGKSHIILIGDAGGFANKLTYEGLDYAIVTGRNAYNGIMDGTGFAVAHRDIFRKKRKEVWMTRLFYSRFGLWLMKKGAHSPNLIKRIFEKYY